MVYSTDRPKAVVPVLVLLFVALWFILQGDLFWCLTLCHFVLVFFSPFSIAITSLGEEELILVLFVRLFALCVFGFVGFLFLLVSGQGCGLWLWHSLDFSLTFCFYQISYERFLCGVTLFVSDSHVDNRNIFKFFRNFGSIDPQSIRIRAVWSEYSMIACAFYRIQTIQSEINENPRHTGWMLRLIWVFAGSTSLIVGFLVRWCNYSFDRIA